MWMQRFLQAKCGLADFRSASQAPIWTTTRSGQAGITFKDPNIALHSKIIQSTKTNQRVSCADFRSTFDVLWEQLEKKSVTGLQ